MPPTEDGSNLDVNNDNNDNGFNRQAHPDFMPDARDIINKFTAPTQQR